MCTIRPFRAIRYATDKSPDISALLAPPYDIIDEHGKAELLGRHPNNFVKIDLPHMPPKSAGPPEAYQNSRAIMEQWLRDRVMVRDSQPALYAYHQVYSYDGRSYVRKMFFGRLRLEPFGEGAVFPHERTFGGPKEDRLALTKATQANLSPIFGLYEDPHNQVAHRLEQALGRPPLAVGTLDGVENRLWAVTDQTAIADVTRLMAPKAIYIADGHHRYGTGLLYRDWLSQQQGPLPSEHPANYVLCVFCAMEDPGLLILPTHRVLPGVSVTGDTFIGDQHVRLKPLSVSQPAEALRELPAFGAQAVAMFNGPSGQYWAVHPARPDLLKEFEPQRTTAWQQLGLAFLHAYLLERVIATRLCGGQVPEIHYVKADADAVAEAKQTNGTAFLMQATTMEELRAVCSAGDLMPQKSTYFYPKLASGLVINPLSD